MIPFHDSYVGRLNLRFQHLHLLAILFSQAHVHAFGDWACYMIGPALNHDFTFSFLARAHDNDSYVAAQILISPSHCIASQSLRLVSVHKGSCNLLFQ